MTTIKRKASAEQNSIVDLISKKPMLRDFSLTDKTVLKVKYVCHYYKGRTPIQMACEAMSIRYQMTESRQGAYITMYIPHMGRSELMFRTECFKRMNDDLPKLIYADWLDEHYRSDEATTIRLKLAKRDYIYYACTDRVGYPCYQGNTTLWALLEKFEISATPIKNYTDVTDPNMRRRVIGIVKKLPTTFDTTNAIAALEQAPLTPNLPATYPLTL